MAQAEESSPAGSPLPSEVAEHPEELAIPGLFLPDGPAEPPAPGPRRTGIFPLAGAGERRLEGARRFLSARLARWARLGTRGLLAALAVHLLAFNLSVVRGSSMAPGIHDGDRILVDQLAFWLGGIQRGDVVVLRYPRDPRLDYIKRVIGLPGDEIEIVRGAVHVNDDLLVEPYVDEGDTSSCPRQRIPEGHYFVLGDNRPHSSDSREFGLVPAECIRGKVDLRIWPLGRFGPVR
jgi:signal peptidase I